MSVPNGEHLPECPVPNTPANRHEPGCAAAGLAAPSTLCCKGDWARKEGCICDRLRACEHRVRKNAIETIYEAQRESYVRGVDAAREAVVAVPYIDHRVSDDGWISLVFDKGEILAAIDALRKVHK